MAHKKNLVVVYHEDCIDGLAAAWTVEKKHGGKKNISITYIPYGHHAQAETEKKILAAAAEHSDILFVDVSPKPEFLKKLLTLEAASIEILDHHKSAHENLAHIKAPHLKLSIDPQHPSAAHMVWDRMQPDTPRPAFFEMIAKMDIAHDLRTDDDYAAAALIDSKGIKNTAEAFASFRELENLSFAELAEKGRSIHADQYNRITKLTDNVMFTRLDHPEVEDLWIPVVNADVQNFGRAISKYLRQLGQEAGCDIAFAWYMQGNGAITMSIRSDGQPDASSIAKHFCATFKTEGGGHATSAAVHFSSLAEFSTHVRLTPRENTKVPESSLANPPPRQRRE